MAKVRVRPFEGMELLPTGLKPFILQRLKASLGEDWIHEVLDKFKDWRELSKLVNSSWIHRSS